MMIPPPIRSEVVASDRLAPTLHGALADEMRLVAGLLELLAEALVGDEQFAARHIDALQTFDLVIQCAGESAGVLDRVAAGAGAHDAIAPVRLTQVQDRLRHALGTAIDEAA